MDKIKISDCCQQIRGVSYKPNDLRKDLTSSSVILLRANNITDGKINFDDVVFVEKKCVSGNQYLRKGDILICASSGSKNLVGKAATVNFDGEYTFGAFCKIIRPQKINADFLAQYFQSPIYHHIITSLSQGANINNIRNEHIDNLELPIFSLEKEKSVIIKLQTIDTISANLRQQLTKLNHLVKSRFIEMFGDLAFNPMNWDEVPLVETCADNDDIKCGPFGTQLGKHEYLREGVPLWGIPQINAAFAIPPTDFLSAEKAEQLSSYSLLPGDIAMSRKGNVGKCAIYPEGSPKGIIHSDVLRIRVDTEVCNPVFLMCQLHFSRAIGTQIDTVSSGAIMAGINVTKLKKIMVYVPPIALQNQFADFVALADKSELVIRELLEKHQLMKEALMQEYFG